MYYTSSDVCQSQGPVWLISQGWLTATIIQRAWVAKCSIELMTCKAYLCRGLGAFPQKILKIDWFKLNSCTYILNLYSAYFLNYILYIMDSYS